MESHSAADIRDTLRLTIRALLESPDGDLELGSILAIMGEDEMYRDVIEQETSPRNAHLELHLGGQKVDGHATVAKSFGMFVTQIAESVKVTVRDIAHSPRLRDELLIEAGPGSVKTTFIAPSRDLNRESRLPSSENGDEVLAEEDSYSEALRRLAVVLANADQESPETPELDAAIGLIPQGSRPALRKALDEAHRQAWSIEGNFSQRGLGVTRVNVRPAAVSFLRERLLETSVSHDTWETTGYLDGHTWSTGTMKFIPAGGSAISASFASTSVQLKVGELDSKPGQKVQAKFSVHVTSGLASSRRSYILEEIEAAPETVLPELF